MCVLLFICVEDHCGGKSRNRSASVCLDCPYTSGPFLLPQPTFLHVLVAAGHKFRLKTGLCWISIKSCQYSYFTLHLSCQHPECRMLRIESRSETGAERPFLHSCSTGLSYEAETFWWAGGIVAPLALACLLHSQGCSLGGQGSRSHCQENIIPPKRRSMKGCGQESILS